MQCNNEFNVKINKMTLTITVTMMHLISCNPRVFCARSEDKKGTLSLGPHSMLVSFSFSVFSMSVSLFVCSFPFFLYLSLSASLYPSFMFPFLHFCLQLRKQKTKKTKTDQPKSPINQGSEPPSTETSPTQQSFATDRSKMAVSSWARK